MRPLFNRSDISPVEANRSDSWLRKSWHVHRGHCQFPLAHHIKRTKMHRRSFFHSIKIGYQPKRLHF